MLECQFKDEYFTGRLELKAKLFADMKRRGLRARSKRKTGAKPRDILSFYIRTPTHQSIHKNSGRKVSDLISAVSALSLQITDRPKPICWLEFLVNYWDSVQGRRGMALITFRIDRQGR